MNLEEKLTEKSTITPDPYAYGRHVRLIKVSDALAICKEAYEEGRMDSDVINEKARIERGWQGYDKGIRDCIDMLNTAITKMQKLLDK